MHFSSVSCVCGVQKFMPLGSSTAGKVCPYSSVCLPNIPAVWVVLAAVPTLVSMYDNKFPWECSPAHEIINGTIVP